MSDFNNNYLNNSRTLFKYYKNLGDKSLSQIDASKLHWTYNDDSNSIIIIVRHLSGNMLSRWTNFLSEDGEKGWRNRDNEFNNTPLSKNELLELWEKGWACLFEAIDPLTQEDLQKIVYIRNEGHTVLEAMNRQLAHYSYHVGQLVFLCKMIKNTPWDSLSIPKGGSKAFNKDKFSKEKQKKNFI